jgi:hypothetical protein
LQQPANGFALYRIYQGTEVVGKFPFLQEYNSAAWHDKFSFTNYETVLGYSSLMTSLQPLGEKGYTWDGSSGASFASWAPGEQPSQNGDCATFNKLGVSSTPCNEPSNFMCEEKKLETSIGQPTERMM